MFVGDLRKTASMGSTIAALALPAAGTLAGEGLYKKLHKQPKSKSKKDVEKGSEIAGAIGGLVGTAASLGILGHKLKKFVENVPAHHKPASMQKLKSRAKSKSLPSKAYSTYKRVRHPAITSKRKNVLRVDFKKGFLNSFARYIKKG